MGLYEEISRYPLSWPVGRPRTAHRRRASFGIRLQYDSFKTQLSVADGVDRVTRELQRLGASNVVISSNLELRLDGLPRSASARPEDPGVAVYFDLEGHPHCLPCDKWDRVADNLAAIAAHVGATRGQLRWGVGDVRASFAGFKALPAPPTWWQVLGLSGPSASADHIRSTFHELARRHHPDRGGDPNRMSEITAAYEEGMRLAVARGVQESRA